MGCTGTLYFFFQDFNSFDFGILNRDYGYIVPEINEINPRIRVILKKPAGNQTVNKF
jgi:hypothetical protein